MATAIEDLVQGLGGEIQLSSAHGRFLQAVAREITQIQQVQAQQKQAPPPPPVPDFLWVKRANSPQVGVGVGQKIRLNIVGTARGVQYPDLVDPFVFLNVNRTYRLTLTGYLDNFSDAVNGFMDVKFFDGAGNPLSDPTADSPTARFRPQTSTFPSSTAAALDMIYVVPASANNFQRSVQIRTDNGNGTVDVPQGGMSLVVEELIGGAV